MYYDSPLLLSAARVREPAPTTDMLMKFDGTAAGHPATVALDTMASHCFVSAAWAARAGIAVQPTNDKVLLAAGAPHQIQGTCSVRLRMGAWHGRVRAFVMPLQECHEVLLGDDWLKEHGATLCFQRRQVTVRCGSRAVTMQCRDAPGRTTEGRRAGTRHARTPPPTDPTIPQLTAVQFLRAARQGATTFLALIQCAAAVDAAPQAGAAVDAAAADGLAVDASPRPPPGPPARADACQLRALLDQFSDVFPPDLPAGLPPERGEAHAIPLEPGAEPPNRPLFRLSAPERAEVEAKVRELLEKGFIEPSISPFGAPVMFARKKDGSLRMVIDYRALNKITVKNRFPLPRIDDLIDRLTGAAVFSTADLSSGFWQIRIKDEDVPKTAFRTPQGLYQWRVLPMGLANSPSTFQMTMQRVLGQYMNKCVLVYLDDMLIYSSSPEQHLTDVRNVLSALREARLYLNSKKCNWMQEEVEFLGHIVTKGGVKVDPRKVSAVAEWPAPTNVHHLRSFLGPTTSGSSSKAMPRSCDR